MGWMCRCSTEGRRVLYSALIEARGRGGAVAAAAGYSAVALFPIVSPFPLLMSILLAAKGGTEAVRHTEKAG